MAMKDLFALAGTISVDSSGAVKNIDKATDAAKQSESKFENSFKRIAAAAVTYLSVTAVWNFGKSMVEAAAAVEAETAQFDAAFKDLGDSATETFSRLEESTGTLATRLQGAGTKAFSQFKGAGLESADALKEMERYLKLATDGAAYYDLSLEETDELLRSFIRGNTEAGDRLGLFTSETQRNTAAQDKYGKKFIELTEAQKQMLMLDISEKIYKDSGAVGQAARESESYANVVGNLKEQWRQFLAQAGGPILEALIPILQSLGGLLEKMAPVLTAITSVVADIFTFLSENVWILEAITAGLTAMAVAYGVWTIATKAQATAQKLLNLVMAASPITWIILGIGLLVAAFVALWRNCEGFREFWKKLWQVIKDAAVKAWDGIKKVWSAVAGFFKNVFNAIKNAASSIWNAIKGFFVGAWNTIKSVWNGAKTFFKNVWSGIKNAFSSVGSFFRNIFTGAWNGIKNVFNNVGQFFRNVVNTIVNAFKNIGKKIWDSFSGVFSDIWNGIKNIGSNIGGGVKKLLGFRTGGVFTGESAIRVAEYPNATTNPEIVTPQNIMADTFKKTLDNYTLNMSGGADNGKILAILQEYLPVMAQMKVVLSTGEMVGALTPRLDKALGERSQRKERGRV